MPNLLVEIGNTALKAAYSEGLTLGKAFRYQGEKTTGFVRTLVQSEGKPDILLIASTKEVSSDEKAIFETLCHRLIILDTVRRDILKAYSLPTYLSYDRAAAVIAARRMFPGKSAALCDFGTTLSVDFISEDGSYTGGVISPGCRTRFKSMNRYSRSLPLVNTPVREPTERSLQADMEKGVISGMVFEIEGHLASGQYSVTVFTGGDASYFADKVKSPVFVVSNLVMMGLASITQDYVEK